MNTSEYSDGLHNFVSDLFSTSSTSQAQMQMSQLRELSISKSDQQCPLHMSGHKIGKCVMDRRVVAEGCPRLQFFSFFSFFFSFFSERHFHH